MRKIVLNLAVTLDGFIEGPNGEIDWCNFDTITEDESTHFDNFLNGIDTILYGRVSYDLWGTVNPAPDASAAEQKLWTSIHSKKKYVFSNSGFRTSESGTTVHSDVGRVVAELKSNPGQDIWLYGGSSLITTFINLNLVDRYLLAVYPVILGGGKPLFHGIADRKNLRLNEITKSRSGVILLDYSTITN